MIQKLVRLQNVGLFQNGLPNNPIDLHKVTLIYGENGRGKSTLASVFRAVSTGDADRMNARKTLDVSGQPSVEVVVNIGGNNRRLEFANSTWTDKVPQMLIFDPEFVEQNVYSGFEVRTEQRQSLLEFALGDQLVSLKNKVDKITGEIEKATNRRSSAERVLNTVKGTLNLQQFIGLPEDPNIERKSDELSKRLEAAKSSQQLLQRRNPETLANFQFDVESVFNLLSKTLEDIEQSSGEIIRTHLQKHNAEGLEDWISQGQVYMVLEECPFCGQSLRGLELIKAYQSYFNEAYKNLKSEIELCAEQVQTVFADGTIDSLMSNVTTNDAKIDAWKDQLPLTSPKLDSVKLRSLVKSIRDQLTNLLSNKRLQPLEKIGSATERQTIEHCISDANKIIDDYNTVLNQVTREIAQFKTTLSSENIVSLRNQLQQLETVQKRHSHDVKRTVQEYRAADGERGRLETEKTQIRRQIDQLLQSTLQQYQGTINHFLQVFGAEFRIVQLQHTYVGSGEPRTEYALEIRGQTVRLGTRTDLATTHSFATTLSESDKRTLALAFFLARLEAEPNLSDRIIVIDDPVSSLDRNRRNKTLGTFIDLTAKCRQLIVFSHEPYFLRDIRDRLTRLRPTPITPKILGIWRAQQGYSSFGECDLDDICSSDYYRHHKIVADYVDGKSTLPLRDVAKAIRPLLEGYYHRRFPRRIPKKTTLGKIIELANRASGSDPLVFLKPILEQISEVNDNTSQFHHDNTDDSTVTVVDAELKQYAEKALKLIYQNG